MAGSHHSICSDCVQITPHFVAINLDFRHCGGVALCSFVGSGIVGVEK